MFARSSSVVSLTTFPGTPGTSEFGGIVTPSTHRPVHGRAGTAARLRNQISRPSMIASAYAS